MATNFVQPGDVLTLPTASGMSSGDPYVVGEHLPVVLTGDAASASPYNAECATEGVFDLSVKAHDGLVNAAVNIGDAIYYNSGATPKLNKDDSGKFFGVALEAITSGSTATIKVKLMGAANVPEAAS